MQQRLIEGAGTAERTWQAWPCLHRLPLCALRDVAPSAARVVVVSPHPDDEILATGGLLAMLASERQCVSVVAVTDGDASHPGSARWPARLLAAQRRRESREGLALLRLAPRVRRSLGLPDGRVQQHIEPLAGWLTAFLLPDDVVLSTWELDGHPDHDATGHATAIACAGIGARHLQVPVWMWHWASPEDDRVPWSRMVRLPLAADTVARKKRALSAHRTQLEPQDTGRAAILEPHSMERLLRPFEYFILPTM